MADPEHLGILKQGVHMWNYWREKHSDIRPDLSWADLVDIDVVGTNFTGAGGLAGANLKKADFTSVDFTHVMRNEIF